MFNLIGFLLKVSLLNLFYFLVRETLKIGNKVTDYITREEFNKELVHAGMIDINV